MVQLMAYWPHEPETTGQFKPPTLTVPCVEVKPVAMVIMTPPSVSAFVGLTEEMVGTLQTDW